MPNFYLAPNKIVKLTAQLDFINVKRKADVLNVLRDFAQDVIQKIVVKLAKKI